ncbi:MAG TPA: YciI-like protein [Terracidiphilus sp.]|nr:YciI-like protein [Terracidiphilus sp.]
MHYLLFYEFVDDYLTRRGQFRDQHLRHAWQASGRGELVLGGALANPPDSGVLLFKSGSSDVAEKFAQADPYVINGVVKSWRVREWTTVVGEGCSTPVHPA